MLSEPPRSPRRVSCAGGRRLRTAAARRRSARAVRSGPPLSASSPPLGAAGWPALVQVRAPGTAASDWCSHSRAASGQEASRSPCQRAPALVAEGSAAAPYSCPRCSGLRSNHTECSHYGRTYMYNVLVTLTFQFYYCTCTVQYIKITVQVQYILPTVYRIEYSISSSKESRTSAERAGVQFDSARERRVGHSAGAPGSGDGGLRRGVGERGSRRQRAGLVASASDVRGLVVLRRVRVRCVRKLGHYWTSVCVREHRRQLAQRIELRVQLQEHRICM